MLFIFLADILRLCPLNIFSFSISLSATIFKFLVDNSFLFVKLFALISIELAEVVFPLFRIFFPFITRLFSPCKSATRFISWSLVSVVSTPLIVPVFEKFLAFFISIVFERILLEFPNSELFNSILLFDTISPLFVSLVLFAEILLSAAIFLEFSNFPVSIVISLEDRISPVFLVVFVFTKIFSALISLVFIKLFPSTDNFFVSTVFELLREPLISILSPETKTPELSTLALKIFLLAIKFFLLLISFEEKFASVKIVPSLSTLPVIVILSLTWISFLFVKFPTTFSLFWVDNSPSLIKLAVLIFPIAFNLFVFFVSLAEKDELVKISPIFSALSLTVISFETLILSEFFKVPLTSSLLSVTRSPLLSRLSTCILSLATNLFVVLVSLAVKEDWVAIIPVLSALPLTVISFVAWISLEFFRFPSIFKFLFVPTKPEFSRLPISILSLATNLFVVFTSFEVNVESVRIFPWFSTLPLTSILDRASISPVFLAFENTAIAPLDWILPLFSKLPLVVISFPTITVFVLEKFFVFNFPSAEIFALFSTLPSRTKFPAVFVTSPFNLMLLADILISLDESAEVFCS